MQTNNTETLFENSPQRYEKLYMMLLDAIPSSVLLIDRNMHVTSANRNFLEKGRRSLSNTIGRRVEEVFAPVIIEQMNITRQIRQVFDDNRPTKGARMLYRAPGVPLRIYYYRLLPFSREQMVDNVILLMDDVTEQIRLSEEVRLVERHLASIVDSASDIVVSTDIEGRILSWNPAAEKISGYSFFELDQSFFPDFFTKDYQKDIVKILAKMKRGEKSQMAEWELMTKQGRVMHVSWVCSPIKGQKSETVGIVAVGRDLTEYRRLEMELFQSQKFASLGVMAGGIAHEIRNPLAICSSAAQFLLEDDITPEFRKECADKIHTGIKRASVVIESLLRFSRPSGQHQMEQIDFCSLLRETLLLVANEAKINKVKFMLDIPKEPMLIWGIANLLQQVFINLLLNAIKAMPDGGTLNLGLEKEKGEVIVRIADTGTGISSENLVKIFDPFYTTSPVGEGTGLGLSISYSIVKQHSGSIKVESAKRKGSTFTVRLPLI